MTKRKLTVADLARSRRFYGGLYEDMKVLGAPSMTRNQKISVICIGIVEEMVKCSAPFTHGKWQFTANAETQECFISDESTEPIASGILIPHDAMHMAELHNLWLKAVAAFGGEVK